MKTIIQLLVLLASLASTISFGDESSEVTQLSEDSQTLSAPEGPSTSPTSEETKTETENEEPKKSDQESLKSTPSKIVSEEDLLKTKTKPEEKVKAKPASESELYLQEADKYKLNQIFKNLALNDVIEQGLRKNYEQNIRATKNEFNDIEWQGIKNAFWMPELTLNLTTTPQRISTLHKSSRIPYSPNPTTPTGNLGLSLGDYTVFNWGKDYAIYLNKKSSFERTNQVFEESKRELKLSLIADFFSLLTAKNIEKIHQDQLRQASFIYRINKEKITIGKTSKQDYYQARSEYLKAQNDFHEAKSVSDRADENMAYLLADEIGTKYVLSESLDYRRIKITLEDALNFTLKNNPTLLDGKTTLEIAERDYDLALKENLPLPKLSVNLGAYNKRFGPETNRTVYETYGGSGNIELVASLNATWAITGEDGLFNSRKLALTRMNKSIASKVLEKDRHFTHSLVRQSYQNILSLQNQQMILEARLPTVQKTFDTVLENYLSGKTRYSDFHISLNELTDTKVLLEQTKLSHLKEKLALAKLAGLEDFPGENFEQLALRIKGK